MQALARDPSFFAAQYQLVQAHDTFYTLAIDHTPQRLALAEKALEALSLLQPNAGETHLARANHYYSAYRDYDRALGTRGRSQHDAQFSADLRVDWFYGASPRCARRRSAQFATRGGIGSAEFLHPSAAGDQLRDCASLCREVATMERALSIRPDDAETKAARGLVFLEWKADTRPLHANH